MGRVKINKECDDILRHFRLSLLMMAAVRKTSAGYPSACCGGFTLAMECLQYNAEPG